MTSAIQLFANGHERGSRLCITSGPDAVRKYLRDFPNEPAQYLEGVRQSLRDYLDSNVGLPGSRDPLETP